MTFLPFLSSHSFAPYYRLQYFPSLLHVFLLSQSLFFTPPSLSLSSRSSVFPSIHPSLPHISSSSHVPFLPPTSIYRPHYLFPSSSPLSSISFLPPPFPLPHLPSSLPHRCRVAFPYPRVFRWADKNLTDGPRGYKMRLSLPPLCLLCALIVFPRRPGQEPSVCSNVYCVAAGDREREGRGVKAERMV